MSTVSVIETMQHLVAFGKDGLCDIQVLDIIYLVPFLLANGQCLEFGIVEECDHTQHLLIVLIIAQRMTIGLQKGHILLLRKVA